MLKCYLKVLIPARNILVHIIRGREGGKEGFCHYLGLAGI